MRLARNPQFGSELTPDQVPEFPAVKAPGTFRIFVIGESEAAGLPYYPSFAFASWLGMRLASQAPDVRWEVVNAALGGL